MSRKATCWLAGVSLLAFAGPSLAQDAAADVESNVIEELVVTAQKRDESLLDVPISITYVDDSQIARQNITDINDLSRAVPALGPSNPLGGLSIRGISTSGFARSAESAVGTVIDGVPGGPIGPIFDVDHVEVLLGPQGTLFGKNTTAGVVSIITKAPRLNEFEAIAHADIGTFEYRNLQLIGNIPLGETAALRVGLVETGYGDVVYNAVHDKWSEDRTRAIRARLRWEPIDALSVNLIGAYSKSDSNGVLLQGTMPAGNTATFRYIETVAGTPAENAGNLTLINQLAAACGAPVAYEDNFISCSDGNASGDLDQYETRTWGLTAQVDYRIGDHTLTSISAYRRSATGDFDTNGLWQNDVDIRPFDFLNKSLTPSRNITVTQELRLASPSDQFVEYVVGAFYQKELSRTHTDQGGALGALPPPLVLRRVNDIDFETWNLAAFGQATINFRDNLRGIVGARFTHDYLRDVSTNSQPPCDAPRICIYTPSFSLYEVDETLKNDNLSWRLGVEYDLNPDLMLYATATRGYKAGFVNEVLSPRVEAGQVLPPRAAVVVKPEIPMAYELGAKGTFFDGRLAASAALFHTRIKNFQTNISIPSEGSGSVPSFGQGNAPYIQTKGLDLNLLGRPMEGLTINASASYTDANYSKGYSVSCSTNYAILPIPDCIPFTPGGTTGSKVVSGQLGGIPKWRLTASGEYERDLSAEVTGFIQADISYRTGYSTLAGDPLFDVGPEVTSLGARIGVRIDDGRYGLAVFGRNLQHDGKRDAGNPARDFAAPGTVLVNNWTFNNVKVFGVTLDARF